MKIPKFVIKNLYPIILIALTAFFFIRIILNPSEVLAGSDIFASAYFPKFFFSVFFNLHHQIPFWDPYMFSGTPFLANPSAGVFYPLYLLFIFLPTSHAFDYLFIIDILLMGLFTYIFAKQIINDNFSSFMSAVIFMFSGTIMYRIFPGHLYVLDAIVWLPLSLYFFEKIISSKKISYAVAAGISLALMIFVGHSQFTFYNLLFLVLYFLIRLALEFEQTKDSRAALKLFSFFVFSGLLALGLSAIQLIPSFELSSLSERSGGISFGFANAFSLPVYQLISFILPNFFGSPFNATYWGKGNIWELGGYLGIIPIIFSLIAVFLNRNKYVMIFLFFAVISILLSLGKYGPIFDFSFNHIPLFNLFRVPARFLYIYAFSMSILSGFGISFILKNIHIKKTTDLLRKFCWLAVILSSLMILISIYFYLNFKFGLSIFETYILKNSYAAGMDHSMIFSQIILDLLFLGIFSFFLFSFMLSFITKQITTRVFMLIIFAITFTQLFIFDYKVINLEKMDKLLATPAVVKLISKDKTLFRVFSDTGTYNVSLMINDIPVLTGYEGEYLKNYRDFLWLTGKHADLPFESFIVINSIDNPTILNLLNTKYVIWSKSINIKGFDFLQSFKETDDGKTSQFFLYKNTLNFSRSYLVLDKTVSSGKMLIADSASVPTLNDIKKNRFIEFNKNDIYKSAKIIKYSPDNISIKVDNDQPAYLILSEIWYPGWKAYDNGVEVKIAKADYILRAIHLNKGLHNVEFVFQPSNFKVGRAISFLALTITIIISLVLLKKKALKSSGK